jgi:glucose/arabinose dehydrogenase
VAAAAPPDLPAPLATPSVTKHPKVVGWPDGKTPTAPAGFTVSLYAKDFDSPRWLYVLPNGDVLVAEARTRPPKKASRREKKGLKESKTVDRRVGPTGSRSCGTPTRTASPKSGRRSWPG